MNIKFELKEESRANKIYLVANFAGGDGDTEHPQEYLMPFTFSEYEQNLEYIENLYKEYKILEKVLESDYYSIKEKYGEQIAKLYDNAPNDPQTDYSMKCYLDSIELIGYDEKGNKYKSYL